MGGITKKVRMKRWVRDKEIADNNIFQRKYCIYVSQNPYLTQ